MSWAQNYDPFGSVAVSTMSAGIPLFVLLVGIALVRMRPIWAAALALILALMMAVWGFGMPARTAAAAALFGAATGLLPIGWLLLNILFLYRLTVRRGLFRALQRQIGGITPDPRLQLLLIAFCFGAFFEGCAGFGAPVAITGAMLVGLGFAPVSASRLALIGNTAPVAFGSLGTPVIALATATGLPLHELSAMIGRQLPAFSLLVPFWLVAVFAGWRGVRDIWPAILVAGVSFAVPQYLVSNFHGPWLVDIVAALCSIAALTAFLRHWKPATAYVETEGRANPGPPQDMAVECPDSEFSVRKPWQAWVPWFILSVCVFLWGLPELKEVLDSMFTLDISVPWLDRVVVRLPPVVPATMLEPAVFHFNPLSAAGTGILVAGLLAGMAMGATPREMLRCYGETLRLALIPLVTIAVMLALGFVMRYSGADITLGLALAGTGVLYPFCGTLLGWLGVATTGSDTASNILFGGLQRATAERIGVSPVLMAAANSSGGVMGKMIDAQSIVVAATATGVRGKEAEVLRYVFFHSVALAALVGLLVLGQAYWWPLSALVEK